MVTYQYYIFRAEKPLFNLSKLAYLSLNVDFQPKVFVAILNTILLLFLPICENKSALSKSK
jgi:hypothetical protein